MKMTDNTILITGGSSGIGRALAEAFHVRGNRVVIAGRDRKKGEEIARRNPGMTSLAVDVATPDGVRKLATDVMASHATLNVVIHCAGIMRDEDWTAAEPEVRDAEEVVATNLLAPIRLTSALLPRLRRQPHATIMTVSSGLAFVPMAAVATYCATKAAIHSYSRSLREQLRGTNVEVLELIPPYVATQLMGPAQAHDPHAMPLSEFIAEVLTILETQPEARELCVQRVLPLRTAEISGREAFEKLFAMLNSPALQPWKQPATR
jgi:uncharacterized oxidoreductase